VEGRCPAEGNPNQQNAPRTQRRISAPSALERIREAARKDRKVKFTALLHHVTFLGFTHICGKARSGNFLLVRQTIRKRMRAKLEEVKTEIKRRRHQPIAVQGQWLGSVVRGYLAYHAIPTNTYATQAFRREVVRHWHRALRRRSQKDRMNWRRMNVLARRWIPVALVQHPWSTERFDVRTRGGSRVRNVARPIMWRVRRGAALSAVPRRIFAT
jgi:hypothetical protein